MLAATAFSLLVPALERGDVGEVLAGFALGAVTLLAPDRYVPHVHARMAERGVPPVEDQPARQRAALLLSALTIHNLPEAWPSALRSRPAGPTSASRSLVPATAVPDRLKVLLVAAISAGHGILATMVARFAATTPRGRCASRPHW